MDKFTSALFYNIDVVENVTDLHPVLVNSRYKSFEQNNL